MIFPCDIKDKYKKNAFSYNSFENSFLVGTFIRHHLIIIKFHYLVMNLKGIILYFYNNIIFYKCYIYIYDKLEVDNSYSIYLLLKIPDGASGTAQLMLRKIVDSEGFCYSLMNPVNTL